MPGKIKQAIKKVKNKRYKKQLAKGEKKGTNVYMGRGIGTVTAKTAKKNNKVMSGAAQLSKRKQAKAMENLKSTSRTAVLEMLRAMPPTSVNAKAAMKAIKQPVAIKAKRAIPAKKK